MKIALLGILVMLLSACDPVIELESAKTKVLNYINIEFKDALTKGDDIRLPKIPKIISDPKSVHTFAYKSDIKIEISKKEKENNDYLYILEILSVVNFVKTSELAEEEIAKWFNVLLQNGTREGVYRALVLDSNYLGRERSEQKASSAAVVLAKKLLEKYLGRKIKEEHLAQVSIFSLKRIISSAALDVVDYFYQNSKLDLYNWYACISEELAKSNSNAYNNYVRKSASKELHKEWAKRVPEQFLKSELIIKIHLAFNSMSTY